MSTSPFAYTVQVVVDSADPHPLADWWAEVLGWAVEPPDEALIRSLVDQGHATADQTTHHQGRLVWAIGAAVVHPDGTDHAPRILFQKVPEPKTVKNRVHLDLRPDGEASTAELDRLLAHGATRIGEGAQGPFAWVVLQDPEGNELCLPVPPGAV